MLGLFPDKSLASAFKLLSFSVENDVFYEFYGWNIIPNTEILQIFSVVLFLVISVVNCFTEIKKTPKWEKYMKWSRQHPWTLKFKINQTLRDRSLPKF